MSGARGGYSRGVGVLKDWDRRNQRTMEWHQHLYEERRRGAKIRTSWRAALIVGAFIVVVKVGRRVLDDLLGFEWTMGILLAIAVGCLWGAVVQQRRKRRAWEGTRQGASVTHDPH